MGCQEREDPIMRVLILGYYGFGNLGDEAILQAILQELKTRFPKSTSVLLYPEEISMEGVEVISRTSPSAILKGLLKCDLLLCGGGSLLQDITSKKSLLYYLGIMSLALLLRKKVFILGQGIGPIRSKWGTSLTSRILNRASFVSLRDTASLNLLRQLNILEKKLHLGADLSLLLKPIEKKKAQELLKREGFSLREKGLALSFRPWQNEEFYHLLIPYIQAFSKEYGMVPVFFPFYPDQDLPLGERLMADLRDGIIIRGTYTPQELMGMIREMDLLVGVRLHSLIFAARTLVPFVGISYDPKVEGFLHLFNREVVTTFSQRDGEALYKELSSIYQDWEGKKEMMEKRVKALQARVHKTWDLVERELS